MPTMRLQEQVTYGLHGASTHAGADTVEFVSCQMTVRVLDTAMSRAQQVKGFQAMCEPDKFINASV